MHINPIRKRIIDLIDDTARDISAFLKDKTNIPGLAQVGDQSISLNLETEIVRLSCYLAAEGNNQLANLSDTIFLHNIHPQTYFKEQLPALIPQKAFNPKIRRKFKLAYNVLIENEMDFAKLGNLLQIINDGNAIMLIQIDSRIQKKIQSKVENLQKQSRYHNIIISKTRYVHIEGHISSTFSLLNGYFELLDAAEWEYVINLSVFDWPLRNNKEIYNLLDGHGKQKSWISLWRDSKWVAHRLFRLHLPIFTDKGFSNFHSEDFGISYWPMTNWRLFRNTRWTILSRTAVSFLRGDSHSLRFLAFLEHSFEPEEFFVGTALMNSHLAQNVYMDNLRYSRGSSDWIGYRDRHIFQLNEKLSRYLFMCPFNSEDVARGEDKLLDWMKASHSSRNDSGDFCNDKILTNNDCLKAFADRVAADDHLILIPIISQKHISLAKNLECSLNRIGYTNVVLLTYDHATNCKKYFFTELLAKISKLPYNSLYIPLDAELGTSLKESKLVEAISRYKLEILLKFSKNGYNVFYVESGTVVIKDVFQRLLQYSSKHIDADIMVGVAEEKIIKPDPETLNIPSLDSNIIFVRKTFGAISFLEQIQDFMGKNANENFEAAFYTLLHKETLVQVTGFGSSNPDPLYPNKYGKSENEKSSGDGHFGVDLTHLFQLGYSRPAEIKPKISKIHILDQIEFINGRLYFDTNSDLDSRKESVLLIHSPHQLEIEKLFKTHKLWYLDLRDTCISI